MDIERRNRYSRYFETIFLFPTNLGDKMKQPQKPQQPANPNKPQQPQQPGKGQPGQKPQNPQEKKWRTGGC